MTFDIAMLEALLPFIAVGFAAQLIDGALGMAFGVISNTLLVSVLGLNMLGDGLRDVLDPRMPVADR